MSINTLFVLIILGGWFSGKISEKLSLPSVLGMTLWGILLSLFFRDIFPAVLWESAPFLRSLALIVILLRAGLGIEKDVLKEIGTTSLKMAFIPCLFEGAAVAALCRYFLGFSWPESGMMGFILAAVSPAVVVPAMLTLKQQGQRKKNLTPTLILAGASLDDITAITFFTVFLNFSSGNRINMAGSALSIPYSIVLGILSGILAGFFFSWLFKKYFFRIRATEKTIILLGFSVLLLQIGSYLHIAGLLSVMTLGFILLEKAETAAHEVADKFSKVWVLAEIFLFVLVGMAVNVETALRSGFAGLVIIFSGLVFRGIGVLASLIGTRFSLKERLFCVIAYVPKATVQAALGSIPLLSGAAGGEMILSIAVLSICVTAPLGLIGMRYSAPGLLGLSLAKNPGS